MNLPEPTTKARATAKQRLAAMFERVDLSIFDRAETDDGDRPIASDVKRQRNDDRCRLTPLTADVSTPTAASTKIRVARPLSLTEQRELRLARRAADDARWEKEQIARQRQRGVGSGVELLRSWPLDVVRMRTAILCDPSGRAVEVHLARAARKFSGTPIWAIVRAALGVREVPEREGDSVRVNVRRTWRSERARLIVVEGLAKLYCSKPSKRRGQWTRVVRGFSVSNFLSLLRSPYETDPKRRPSRSALAGRPGPGQLGYLRSLEQAGFCYRQQLPASEVAPWEVGNVHGRAYNRYWLVGLASGGPLATELKLQAWHDAGWDVTSAQLVVVDAPSRAPP